jgi:hypothetical protein
MRMILFSALTSVAVAGSALAQSTTAIPTPAPRDSQALTPLQSAQTAYSHARQEYIAARDPLRAKNAEIKAAAAANNAGLLKSLRSEAKPLRVAYTAAAQKVLAAKAVLSGELAQNPKPQDSSIKPL